MDTEPTFETQLLAEEKRQTAALESLRGMVLLWSAIGGLVLVIALITWVNAGR